ncbi:hypothetical protein D3C83_07680 [compost metagenome]
MRNVIEGVERTDLDAGIGFLQRLAQRALKGGFAVLHVACRHGPQSVARLDGAAAQQDAVLPLGYAAHHHARILVMNRMAGVAYMPGQRVSGRYFERDRCAAVAAEFHGDAGSIER